MLHPLFHGLELRGHEAGRLSGRKAEGVLEPRSVKAEKGPRGGGARKRPEDFPRVPPPREHLRSVQGEAHPRPDLKAEDGGAEKVAPLTGGCSVDLFGAGHQRGEDEGSAVHWRKGMEIVELEALNESAVEEGCRKGIRPSPPADESRAALALEAKRRLHARARPGEPRADKGAGDAVEEEVLGPFTQALGNIGERLAREPAARIPVGPSGPVGGSMSKLLQSLSHHPFFASIFGGLLAAGEAKSRAAFSCPPSARPRSRWWT